MMVIMPSLKRKLFKKISGPDRENLRRLEKKIGYRFKNPSLALKALRHRSVLTQENFDHTDSYERLEFLGDAVITLVTSKYLMKKFPEAGEGELTKLKSLVVSGEVLSEQAQALQLGDNIFMSEGEDRSGGREKPSILEDVFEALAGAVFLDGGLSASEKFIRKNLLRYTESIYHSENHVNYKSILLEYAQSEHSVQPKYRVISEEGPDHNKIYRIEASIENRVLGVGEGTSKKRAEQQAAKAALQELGVKIGE